MISLAIFLSLILLPIMVLGTIPKATDLLAAELERTSIHVELPRPDLKGFVGTVGNKPAPYINSIHASNFHIQGFEVRFSEAFTGAPAGTYDKNALITNLNKIFMKLPMSEQAWAYGATKTFESTVEIELSKTVKDSSEGALQKAKRTLGLIQFKASKYPQERLGPCLMVGFCKVNPQLDVLVIEEITKFEESIYRNLRPSLAPPVPFPIGELSGNIVISRWFIHQDFEIIAPFSFYAQHVIGLATGENFGNKMVTISSNRVKFHAPDDISTWKMWERRILNSYGYPKIGFLERSSSKSDWLVRERIESGIQVTATRGKLQGSGKDAIFIENFVLLQGPSFNTFKKHIINRPPILSLPMYYGNVRTWVVPYIVQIEGVEVRLTEELLLKNYYLASGIKSGSSFAYTLPDKPLTLDLGKNNVYLRFMREGVPMEVTVHESTDFGHFSAKGNSPDWEFKDRVHGKVIFKAVKAFKEVSREKYEPIIVLTSIYGVTRMK